MTNRSEKYFHYFGSSIVKYVLFPLSVFFLFRQSITDLLSKFVSPLFRPMENAHWSYDVCLLLLISIAFGYLVNKIRRGATIPLKSQMLVLAAIIIFTFYRFFDDSFVFAAFSFPSSIKLADAPVGMVLLITAVDIASKMINKKGRKENPEVAAGGFEVDKPISFNEETDTLKRYPFVKTVVEKLSSTDISQTAFTVGIVAPWGGGKSTFLKVLGEKAKSFIVIEFNLWMYGTHSQIIEGFFKLLKDNLKKSTFTLDNRLEEYAKSLVKNSQGNILGNLLEKIFPEAEIEEQYKTIRSEMQRINKKVLILIDDLDRLDKKEIFEVIRLIRNTANFPNLVFVVAYDRNYILNAIEEINHYNVDTFLEKVFQIEFTLPKIDNLVLQNEIKSKLNAVLTKKGKICYDEFLKHHNFISWKGTYHINLTKEYISNIRDVIRFANSFALNYQFVKDEIYFPDFYHMELIRFKHPEILQEFYRTHEEYITLGINDEINEMFQNTSDESASKKQTNYFRKFLTGKKEVYKIDEITIQKLSNHFNFLFGKGDNYGRKGIDAHLSVRIPSMFERYFRFDVDGHLSEVEFSKARQMPLEEFRSKLDELAKNEVVFEELRNRILIIRTFDNRDDFEKIFSCIVYIANKPNSRDQGKFVGFSGYYKQIAELIGNKNLIKNFYESDEKEFKLFFDSILKIKELNYMPIHELVYHLRAEYDFEVKEIYTRNELDKLLSDFFQNAILNNEKFTTQLWWHFLHYYRILEKDQDRTASNLEDSQRQMQNFIFTKDTDGFIRKIAIGKSMYDEDQYLPHEAVDYVFGTKDNFVKALSEFSGKSEYKEECLRFYSEWNEAKKQGKEADFGANYFALIPVKKGFSDQE